MSAVGGHQSLVETHSRLPRDDNDNIQGTALVGLVARKLGLAGFSIFSRPSFDEWEPQFAAAAAAALPQLRLYDPYRQISRAHLCGPAFRAAIAQLVEIDMDVLWPSPSRRHAHEDATAHNLAVLKGSAEAFRVAIDALPVGRDIRERLGRRLDLHIAQIEEAFR